MRPPSSVAGLQQLAEVICDSDGTSYVPFGAAPPPGSALSDAKARVVGYARTRAASQRPVGAAEEEESFWARRPSSPSFLYDL